MVEWARKPSHATVPLNFEKIPASLYIIGLPYTAGDKYVYSVQYITCRVKGCIKICSIIGYDGSSCKYPPLILSRGLYV
jgi:hypothetical protein